MSTYKTEGIIVRRNNYHESSLILDIYTKDYGKVEAVARSARKEKGKLKGHLEIFLYGEFIFARGRNVDTITSSLTVESFMSIRRSIPFLYAAIFVIELADKMILEGHKDERIFFLLKRILCELDKLAASALEKESDGGIPGEILSKRNLLILLFQMHMMSLSGFSPELSKCVSCAMPIVPGENYFSFRLGGLTGKECAKNDRRAVPISDNEIKLMRLFQFEEVANSEYLLILEKHIEIAKKLKVDPKLIYRLIILMDKFVEFNVDRDIKSVDFLRAA